MSNVNFGVANINFNLLSKNPIFNQYNSCSSFGVISISNEGSMRIESTIKDIVQEIQDKLTKSHDQDMYVSYTKFQRYIEDVVEIVVKKGFCGVYIGEFKINVDFERCNDCNKMVIYDQEEIIKLTIELKG